MKLPESLAFRKAVSKDRKGVALLTVLTVMALTTILVLTFFSLATSENRASSTYSHGIQAQQVAEEAVNLVIAQIREATVTSQPTNAKAWASQPGAIRVWESNGSLDYTYKLYSDDELKTEDNDGIQKDFDEIAKWADKPEHFVDLNEPVIRGEKVYYPVVHPAASILPEWPQALDGDDRGVEGFSYDSDKVEEGPIGKKAADVAKATDGHLAMPVTWIYQLADGTLGTLAKSGSETQGYQFLPFPGGNTPSEENPIVARFAFWADDETTKLNLNTHAGGLAWDIPKAGGELDMDMGRYQPAQKEWQRYPGHPATTHLSPALAPGVLDIVNDRDAMEMLYRVVPRVVGGGSESGTRLIDTRNPEEANGLVPDTEPLFPSIDDMIMRSDRTPHEFPDAKGRPIPEDELSEYLERSKFFITAYSRAPETNLFNLPRVAMWPIFNAERSSASSSPYQTRLTAFDRLIHYCSSVGTAGGENGRYDYIFKRERADSPTYDFDQIPRNQQLYEYLDTILHSKIPGWGTSFAYDKYTSDETKQLLTQIFDYIRCTNLHDDSIYKEDFDRAFSQNNTANHWTYTNGRNLRAKSQGLKGHGQVVPIRIGDTKGFGRFYSLASANVMAICAGMPRGFDVGKYPGLLEYVPGNWDNLVDPPQGEVFFNLPPLPSTTKKDMKGTWPQWLKQLETAAVNGDAYAQKEFDAAWQEENWNWQLAFLDDRYRANVLANPTALKFNRGALGPDSLTTKTRLRNDEILVQGAFLFNLFTPSIGWVAINSDMEIEIDAKGGMTFNSVDGPVPFLGFGHNGAGYAGGPNRTYLWSTNWTDSAWGGRRYGGIQPFEYAVNAMPDVLVKAGKSLTGTGTYGGRSRLTPIDRFYDQLENGLGQITTRQIGGSPSKIVNAYRYDLVTVPFKISGGTLGFTGGDVQFKFYPGRENCEGSAPDIEYDFDEPVQDITVKFENFTAPAPVMVAPDPGSSGFKPTMGWINEFGNLARDSFGYLERNSVTADPGNPLVVSAAHKAARKQGSDRSRTHGRLAQINVHRRPGMLSPGDVIRSVEIIHGDARLSAAQEKITPNGQYFDVHRYYGDSSRRMAHSIVNSVGGRYWGASIENNYLIIPDLPKIQNRPPYNNKSPLPFGGNLKSSDIQRFGDFDNGAGLMIDGPYINKPDEGNTHALKTKFQQELVGYWEEQRNYGEFPYFNREWLHESGGPAYFSPNRLISGPGMLGSMPTGVEQDKPWQTLLFRPDVDGNGYDPHPGAQDPPDHLIMDLFWMPVVEPYAISEPLSTAGKVNINYQIVPFLHVDRTTALRGVLRSEFMLCVPNQWNADYKHNHGRGRGYHWRDNPYGGKLQGKRLRSAIVESETLEQMKERFDDGRDIYKSATEICEVHLIPQEVTDRLGLGKRGSIGSYKPDVADMASGKYWRDHSLIGDNSRERPYTNIHQRLTSKSNTFKVHYRAQVLKQSRRESAAEYGVWRPETDTIQADYRGSSIVERFVDPNSKDIPDFAKGGAVGTESIDKFYQFRVVNPTRFAP